LPLHNILLFSLQFKVHTMIFSKYLDTFNVFILLNYKFITDSNMIICI